MSEALRVLYLAPPSTQPDRVSRYSFLDEEIRALAARGVHAYVLSRVEGTQRDDGYLHVRMLPTDSGTERRRTLAFLARHLGRVPLPNLLDVQQCYRGVRVERFAAELIERERIHLVHSYFGWPRGFGGYLATAATGRPLVAGLRGSDVNTIPDLGYGARLDPSFDRSVRRLLRAADRTVFNSAFLRKKGITLGARADTAHVIRKGVRLDQFTASLDKAEARGILDLPGGAVILAVSGLVRIKGLHHVLEALATIKGMGRQFRFVVCGEGPEKQALEDQAKTLNVAEWTSFVGRVPRHLIPTYFAAADLLVHGSIIEAAGNVLLESMASGTPVICTDAGGPAEYVKHGVTGFVLPVGDTQRFAEHVVMLLDDSTLRENMGVNAREWVVRGFGYDRMVDETLSVYTETIASRRGDALQPLATLNARHDVGRSA